MSILMLILSLFAGSLSVQAISQKDGVYQLGTAQDLVDFASLVNGGQKYISAVLTADIDCGDKQFSIGYDRWYSGMFDGQGHTVTINLKPEREMENLFCHIDHGGEVRNLIVRGTITSDCRRLAGICGQNKGVIANCASFVTIKTGYVGDSADGGITGSSSGGAIINCLSAVNIVGKDGGQNTVTTKCGGIAGWCDTRTTMRNNLVIGTIDLSDYVECASISRNPGQVQNDNANNKKGHYLQNFYKNLYNDGSKGVQVTDAQLASGEVCYKLNAGLATPQWTQNPGDAYPMPLPTYGQTVGASVACDCLGRFAEGTTPTYTFGGGVASETHTLVNGRCSKCGYFDFHMVPRDVDGYYLLSTADDCKWYNWRRYYGCDDVNVRLAADIDLGDAPYFTNNDNWCGGDFDGAGHSLTINFNDAPLTVSDVNGYGLIEQPYSAGNNCLFHNLSGTVHDLVVHGTITTQGQYAGSVTNHIQGSDNADNLMIYRIYSDVNIVSTYEGDGTHGGFVGVADKSSMMSNICFAGSITSTATKNVGGIIGWCSKDTKMYNVLVVPTSISVAAGNNNIISRNPDKIIDKSNIYYLNNFGTSIPDWATQTTSEAVSGGALAYTFNGNQSVTVNWTQTLGTDPIPMPLLTHKKVYWDGTAYSNIVSDLYMRCQSNSWAGIKMDVIPDTDEDTRHFRLNQYVRSNRIDGTIFNFATAAGKSGADCWGPSNETYVKAGDEVTDFGNYGDKCYVFANQTGYIQVDVYCTKDGGKVVFTDKTLEAMADKDAIYVVGEQTTGWSRESSVCQKLSKTSEGVYEGTIEVKRDNTIFDAIRLITVADVPDDDDNCIGLNFAKALGKGTYDLCSGNAGRIYLRKGKLNVKVDFNTGKLTTDFVDVTPSYVYAVGTLKDCVWQNTNTAYTFNEVEPGIFLGTVTVIADSDSRFSLFAERTSSDWATGRFGPDNQSIHPVKGEPTTNNISFGSDKAWRVPEGTWVVVLNTNDQSFVYAEDCAVAKVSSADYATWVAPFDVTRIPTGVEVYGAEDKGTFIGLNAMTAIPADEAVVLKNAGTYVFVKSNDAVTSDVSNDLTWSDAETTADGTHYVLAKKSGKVGFYKATSGTKIAARKAFLQSSSSIQTLYFDEETAIESVPEAVETNVFDGAIYNVAGQRISTLQKGVNIVGGKKVLK
ncbi:MAG: hypothetical protein HUK03_03955 [Bacteroidaceae bacterium]|nr:hypothetical protein [Bacteroidaceae bacterium]